MTDNTKLYEALYFSMESSVRNKIDTQVILQLMVKKGLVTSTEVAEMREYISWQPLYKSMLESLNGMKKEINYSKEFDNIFEKVLNGTATQEERDKLLKSL